jgi:hypothetical protein
MATGSKFFNFQVRQAAVVVVLAITSGVPLAQGADKGPASSLMPLPIALLRSQTPQGAILCTGTAIAPDAVLTAAHCVDGQPSKIEITFPIGDVTISRQGYSRPVLFQPRLFMGTWERLRESWNSGFWQDARGDLAVVMLTMELPDSIRPVRVSALNSAVSGRLASPARVYGFGGGLAAEQNTDATSRLRSLDVRVVRHEHRPIDLELDAGTSLCVGDSGGPVLVDHDGEPVLVGVISRGRGGKYGCHRDVTAAGLDLPLSLKNRQGRDWLTAAIEGGRRLMKRSVLP